MNEHQKKMIEQAKPLVEIMMNLQECLEQAGGMGMTLSYLEQISAAEFLCIIAPNDIRFKYDGE